MGGPTHPVAIEPKSRSPRVVEDISNMALHRHKLVVYSFRQSLWERWVEVDDPEQKDNGGSSHLLSVKSLSL